MELLSPMVVMSEGLGFNLCVVLFLKICVLNLPQGLGQSWVTGCQSLVRGCQSLVRGAMLGTSVQGLSHVINLF